MVNMHIKYASEFQYLILKNLCALNFIKGHLHCLKKNLIFIIVISVLQNYIFYNFTKRKPYLKCSEEFEFNTKLKFTKLCVGFSQFHKKQDPV